MSKLWTPGGSPSSIHYDGKSVESVFSGEERVWTGPNDWSLEFGTEVSFVDCWKNAVSKANTNGEITFDVDSYKNDFGGIDFKGDGVKGLLLAIPADHINYKTSNQNYLRSFRTPNIEIKSDDESVVYAIRALDLHEPQGNYNIRFGTRAYDSLRCISGTGYNVNKAWMYRGGGFRYNQDTNKHYFTSIDYERTIFGTFSKEPSVDQSITFDMYIGWTPDKVFYSRDEGTNAFYNEMPRSGKYDKLVGFNIDTACYRNKNNSEFTFPKILYKIEKYSGSSVFPILDRISKFQPLNQR